jgi:hypothetical protein
VQELRGFIEAQCPIENDHDQPWWLRSFKGELSLVENYRRGKRGLQGEFRSILMRNSMPAAVA